MWPLLLCYFFHLLLLCTAWLPRCLNTAGKVLWLQIVQMFIVSCSDWFWVKNSLRNMVIMTAYFACIWWRRYGIATFSFFSFLKIKLSKFDLIWQNVLKPLLPSSLCMSQTSGMKLTFFSEVSLQNGLLNTLLNSIKFHKFQGTSGKMKGFKLCTNPLDLKGLNMKGP